MFDDEADTIPQSQWAAPDDDAQAIDAVLNHRLLEDISMSVRSTCWDCRLTYNRQRSH